MCESQTVRFNLEGRDWYSLYLGDQPDVTVSPAAWSYAEPSSLVDTPTLDIPFILR